MRSIAEIDRDHEGMGRACVRSDHGCTYPACECDRSKRIVPNVRGIGAPTLHETRYMNKLQHTPACQDCNGTGQVFSHADDCTDDLCALNGDMHSCAGKVEQCGTCGVEATDDSRNRVRRPGMRNNRRRAMSDLKHAAVADADASIRASGLINELEYAVLARAQGRPGSASMLSEAKQALRSALQQQEPPASPVAAGGGEPVAWRITRDKKIYGIDLREAFGEFYTGTKVTADEYVAKGWKVTPLYASPPPAPQQDERKAT